jgi:hypothetical protein
MEPAGHFAQPVADRLDFSRRLQLESVLTRLMLLGKLGKR